MAWNATAPLGTVSVKANNSRIQDNFTYIQTIMGDEAVGTNLATTKDHFFNISANYDGRHRFFQSVGFTEGGLPAHLRS